MEFFEENSILFNNLSKNPKPRCWVKWFVNPWIHKKGKGSLSFEGEDPVLMYSLGISSR